MRIPRLKSAALAAATAWLPAAAQADDLTSNYSYIQKDFFAAQPEGVAYGRGGSTELDYALSDNAFYYLGGLGESISPGRERRYDAGIGINSTAADGGPSFFATVGWNHMGFDRVTGPPGQADHGFGASAGVRYALSERWECFALLRRDHNDVLTSQTSGGAGLWYRFAHKWQLGAGVMASNKETDYLISIRAFF